MSQVIGREEFYYFCLNISISKGIINVRGDEVEERKWLRLNLPKLIHRYGRFGPPIDMKSGDYLPHKKCRDGIIPCPPEEAERGATALASLCEVCGINKHDVALYGERISQQK